MPVRSLSSRRLQPSRARAPMISAAVSNPSASFAASSHASTEAGVNTPNLHRGQTDVSTLTRATLVLPLASRTGKERTPFTNVKPRAKQFGHRASWEGETDFNAMVGHFRGS